VEDGPASCSVEAVAVELPALPVEEADQAAATVVAEMANDHSKKRPKMTPTTAVAAASDSVAIDPFVVLPRERGISQHHLLLNLAGLANYSTAEQKRI
jgi:hypothetical protein